MADSFGRYAPLPLPTDTVQSLALAVETELKKIANTLLGMSQTFILLEELNAVPDKYFEGMIVRADGTNWDPGSGRGVYCYQGGAWTLLG